MSAFVAASGPWLVRVSVYTSSPPLSTVAAAFLVSARSAAGGGGGAVTVVLSVSWLLAGWGSFVSAVTAAVLVRAWAPVAASRSTLTVSSSSRGSASLGSREARVHSSVPAWSW